MKQIGEAIRRAVKPSDGLVRGLVSDITRSRTEVLTENALLRQQLIVLRRSAKRPKIRPHERGVMVVLAALTRTWRDAVLLVKPETIVRWHRQGFRLLWRRKSRRHCNNRRPRVSADTIALIRQMAVNNRLWGAERIRGELLKLGIRVAKRTIQRYICRTRPPSDGQRWRTFLRNHTVWACDFLQTYDIWFRPIFAFFIIDVNTRCVVHVGVTRAPTQGWTAQQLRNATPFGKGPDVVLRDRDNKFGADFDRVVHGVDARIVRTAVQAPMMNAHCERFVGSVRRECLDHVIILGERHLLRILGEYAFDYFNTSRPHQGIEQRIPAPVGRVVATSIAHVKARPVLGGLHHDYRMVA